MNDLKHRFRCKDPASVRDGALTICGITNEKAVWSSSKVSVNIIGFCISQMYMNVYEIRRPGYIYIYIGLGHWLIILGSGCYTLFELAAVVYISTVRFSHCYQPDCIQAAFAHLSCGWVCAIWCINCLAYLTQLLPPDCAQSRISQWSRPSCASIYCCRTYPTFFRGDSLNQVILSATCCSCDVRLISFVGENFFCWHLSLTAKALLYPLLWRQRTCGASPNHCP